MTAASDIRHDPAIVPTTSHLQLGQKNIPELDGIRGIAILMVVLHHMIPIRNNGWVGVDLFFVLSGFLITRILLKSKQDPHFFRNFYMRRTLRIFPLYYLVVATCLLVLPAITPYLLGNSTEPYQNPLWLLLYGTNVVSYTNGFYIGSRAIHLTHFWSLAVEEHFYLFWPLLVYTFSRRKLFMICCALLVLPLIARTGWVAAGRDPWFAYMFTLFRMDALTFGAVVAAADHSVRGQRFLRKIAKPILLIVGPLLVLSIPVLPWGRQSWFISTIGYSLIELVFMSLLVLTIYVPHDSRWRKLCRSPLLSFFGRYSYALYVFHPMLIELANNLHIRDRLEPLVRSRLAAEFVSNTLAISLSIGIALVSWHLYEKQFLKLKHRFETA